MCETRAHPRRSERLRLCRRDAVASIVLSELLGNLVFNNLRLRLLTLRIITLLMHSICLHTKTFRRSNQHIDILSN